MTSKRPAAVIVAAGAVLAAAWYLGSERNQAPSVPRPPAAALESSALEPAAAPPTAAAPAPAVPRPPRPIPDGTLPDDAIDAYQRSGYARLERFRDRLQGYVDSAPDGIPADGGAGVAALLDDVDALVDDGYLTAPEALSIRLSLLRYSLSEDEYEAVSAALLEDARESAEAAERAWAEREDPQLARYRAEERRIVAEVEAIEALPDGVSRQAYLRERLRQARSAIYGSQSSSP